MRQAQDRRRIGRGGRAKAAVGHVTDQLPSYALGILEIEQVPRVQHHLAGCSACRSELEALERTVGHLAKATLSRTPPADLLGKVLRRIGARPSPREPRTGTMTPWRALPWFAAAACLAAAIGLGVAYAGLRVRTRPASSLPVLAVLVGTETDRGAAGVLLVGDDPRSGSLVVRGLAELEERYQYQLWLIDEGARQSGGVFSVDVEGQATIAVAAPLPLTRYTAYGVTVEPAGGSPGPTGSRVLFGAL